MGSIEKVTKPTNTSKCLLETKGYSCFTSKVLDSFINDINRKYSPTPKLSTSPTKKAKWEAISKFMEKLACRQYDEACWVDTLRNREAEKFLIPKLPGYWKTGNTDSMRSDTVSYALERYEHHYPNFTYLGTFPADFYEYTKFGTCVSRFMCSFNIKPLEQKNMCFGMTINTDPHHKSGEHWVAVFCDTDRKRKSYGIYFYDSYGFPPQRQIKKFIKAVMRQMKELGHSKFPYEFNTHEHQTLEQNCGVFCINMIVECLKGNSFLEFCKNGPDDIEIERYRQKSFRD